jgi:CRISPR/Cas system CMR subunit Cmr4 (Cas7 group RAMP superfamily)
MQLAVVPRDGNQTWLSDFLHTISTTLRNYSSHLDVRQSFRDVLESSNTNYQIDKSADEQKLFSEITIIRENLSKLLAKKIIIDYLGLLSDNNLFVNQDMNLAFDFYGDGILVWVETQYQDDNVEKILSSIESDINKKYSSQKIEMRTVVFDKSYDFCFPPQYVNS